MLAAEFLQRCEAFAQVMRSIALGDAKKLGHLRRQIGDVSPARESTLCEHRG
jgi:hypothetical protein